MKIHWDEAAHLPEFIRLNNAWIEKHFQLEAFDRELAKDPASILRRGGHVLSITVDNRVVAVCALFRESDDSYELARMAVSEQEQGKGFGHRLLREVLDYSKQNGIRKIFLISNTRMKPAIRLYQSFSFRTVFKGQHPVYRRGNIVMEKMIDAKG